MEIKLFTMEFYERVYELWTRTKGVGLRDLDDSASGIEKLVKRNPYTSYSRSI